MANVSYQHLNPPVRMLLGPGPSNVHPRVQLAMAAPMVGHLDPYFVKIMDDTVELLRYLFRTQNKLTFPISGTGSAGMEASFCNFLEPGDTVVIGVNGVFGERMVDNAARLGAEVVPVAAEWGNIVDAEAIEAALKSHKKVKMLALVHAETSTGVTAAAGRSLKTGQTVRRIILWWIPLHLWAARKWRLTTGVSISVTAAPRNASAVRRDWRLLPSIRKRLT